MTKKQANAKADELQGKIDALQKSIEKNYTTLHNLLRRVNNLEDELFKLSLR